MAGMKTSEAIRHMIDESGISCRSLSASIGRSPTFVSTTLAKDSTPRADTLAAMADAMGYELVLRGRGEEIRIDPPGTE